jgi:hypothetical protein
MTPPAATPRPGAARQQPGTPAHQAPPQQQQPPQGAPPAAAPPVPKVVVQRPPGHPAYQPPPAQPAPAPPRQSARPPAPSVARAAGRGDPAPLPAGPAAQPDARSQYIPRMAEQLVRLRGEGGCSLRSAPSLPTLTLNFTVLQWAQLPVWWTQPACALGPAAHLKPFTLT